MDYGSLRNYEIASKDLYMDSLLEPENYVAKIPGPLPISSATASLRDNFSITPNISGKFLLIIDPFQNEIKLYQSNDLDGTGNGTVTTISTPINATIVDQFRLVSSSVIIRYYGNFNQMSGIMVGAVTTDPSGSVDWRNFQNIEDLTNKYITKCVDGIKLIYSPMDNRATEFYPITTYTANNHPLKNQYLFVIYGDQFPNNTCLRVDFFKNIEYTTKPNYREYILQSKSVPVQFELPNIASQVSNAPNTSGYGFRSYNNNNIAYDLKLLDVLKQKGLTINPKMLM